MGLLVSSLIIALFCFWPNISKGDERPQEQTPYYFDQKHLWTIDELKVMVYASADKFGVNRNQLLTTVQCEAKKQKIDGVIVYDSTAKSDYDEESYGLAQWNLPSHNTNLDGETLTYAQVTNAQYSLDAMARYFSLGLAYKWTCYRTYYV